MIFKIPRVCPTCLEDVDLYQSTRRTYKSPRHLWDGQQKRFPKPKTLDTLYKAYKKRIPRYDILKESIEKYQFIVQYSTPSSDPILP